ncbi:MAG: tetratricopeptide repeat protein [Bacteroidota bacterium]|nr:tetratricopeptide repeat protein [Bacteroidota bacterium]
MKYLLLVFVSVFLIGIGGLSAQKMLVNDSLEVELDLERDPLVKTEILGKLSRKYVYSNFNEALRYAEEVLHLSENIETSKISEKIELKALLLLAEIYWTNSKYKEAMQNAAQASEIAKRNNMQKELARSYLITGSIYLRIDNYSKSLEYYFKSLKIFREIDNQTYICSSLNNIGSVFSDQNRHEKALEYFSEALKTAESANDSAKIELCLGNVASAHSSLDQYEIAKNTIRKALRLRQGKQINSQDGMNAMNLAIIFSKLQEFDSAAIFYDQALLMFNQLNDESGKALFYINYANLFYDLKNYAKSMEYALMAYNNSLKFGFSGYYTEICSLLRDLNYLLDKPEEVYKYSIVESRLKDSLYFEDNNNKKSNFELQYEFDLKQQKKELSQQRKNYIFIIIIIFFVSVASVGILIISHQRQKAKNILLEKQKLKAELDFKNKEFTSSVLFSMKKNELLSEISENLNK